MATPQETSTKSCVRCGVDCSNISRVKDRNGRYCCGDCYEAMKSAGSKPARPQGGAPSAMPRSTVVIDLGDTPAAGTMMSATAHLGDTGAAPPQAPDAACDVDAEEIADDALLEEILDDEPDPNEVALLCPRCGVRLGAGAVVCVDCGFNTKTGRQLETAAAAPVGAGAAATVAAAKKAGRKEPEVPMFQQPASVGAFLRSPLGFGTILTAVFASLYLIARSYPEFELPYLVAAAAFAGVVVFVTLLVAASQGFVKFVLCLIPPYTLYFLFVKHKGRHLQAAAIVTAGAVGLGFLIGWAPLLNLAQ